MEKLTTLLAWLLLHACAQAQCLSVPSFPSCTGTETLVTTSENITVSQTRFYYGTAATLSNVKLSGGTLVVCNDLTLNDLVFDSGTIYVKPSATLVVNNPAGLIVRGNTRIYNAGTFQCLGNFVMEGTWASAAKPNVFINTQITSYFKMPNQYFVINNPYSWLVNNGTGDFHGIITDPLSAASSVCLGMNSQTRMRVIYNKAKNTYAAPNGPACVLVEQYSQFQDTLTMFPSINVCLGATHTSDASCIPWGCKPNAWGSAQVTNGCSSCSSVLTFLTATFISVEGSNRGSYNAISWNFNTSSKGLFYIQRSADGRRFTSIDSMKSEEKNLYSYDDKSDGAYYRIIFSDGQRTVVSTVIQIKKNDAPQLYPNPFRDVLYLPHATGGLPPGIKITDAAGRVVSNYSIHLRREKVEIRFEHIPPGIYFIHVEEKGRWRMYRAVRQNVMM